MFRYWWLWLSLPLLFFLFLRQWPDRHLHLIGCDLDPGGAILISQGFNQVLINTGPDKHILDCLSRHLPFWDRQIDLIILSQPGRRYSAGLGAILSHYRVKYLALNYFASDDRHWRQLLDLLNDHKIRVFQPERGLKICLGLMTFEIVWPDKEARQEEMALLGKASKYRGWPLLPSRSADFSRWAIASRLQFGRFSAFFPGDLGRRESQLLAWRQQLKPVIFLKAWDHGAARTNPASVYQALHPRLVFIASGRQRRQQPAASLLTFLKQQGIHFWRRDRQGELELVSDGRHYWLKGDRR